MSTRDQERLATKYSEANPIRAMIITMSDRAYAKEYEDEGGPMALSRLRAHYTRAELAIECEAVILPDDREVLRKQLVTAREGRIDIVITTGGTGIGPRDITPDVILEMADKVIPGVMELIRARHGQERPLTALSRTVAATMGSTLVYAIPGNPKGVEEYMTELLKTMNHLLCVLHGIEAH